MIAFTALSIVAALATAQGAPPQGPDPVMGGPPHDLVSSSYAGSGLQPQSVSYSGSAGQGQGLDFFFFGDWGQNVPANESQSGVAYEEKKIANQIAIFAAQVKPAFFIPLGDNFYPNGPKSSSDPIWQTNYRSIYTAPDTYVPWYPVLGNHDYFNNNSQAEIDYYKERRDNRWTMPDYQYTRTWTIPGSTKTMQIVFINTPAICPEAESGPGLIDWPTDPVQMQFIWQPTIQWVENALAASTADVLLVAGHYHVYTNTAGDTLAEGGTPEMFCLQARLMPLLKKYRVTAYLNGHEHNFEHHFIGGINYLTAGHGCDVDDPMYPASPPGLLFNKTIGGFAMMHVSPEAVLNFTYVDLYGNSIYHNTIYSTRDSSNSGRRSLRGSK